MRKNIHESNIFKSIQAYLQSHEVQLASLEALEGSKGNTMSEHSWAKQECYPFGLYVNVSVIFILTSHFSSHLTIIILITTSFSSGYLLIFLFCNLSVLPVMVIFAVQYVLPHQHECLFITSRSRANSNFPHVLWVSLSSGPAPEL